MIKCYRKLYDDAEKAVSSDSTFLKRVWQQRLSIQFAELEIARTGDMTDAERIKKELELFRKQGKMLGCNHLE